MGEKMEEKPNSKSVAINTVKFRKKDCTQQLIICHRAL